VFSCYRMCSLAIECVLLPVNKAHVLVHLFVLLDLDKLLTHAEKRADR